MRFFILYGNGLDGEEKPWPEAIRGSYTDYDWRTVDDPTKLWAYRCTPEEACQIWYSEGSNHRRINGRIVRDFEREGWLIEITTLEQLIALRDKYGDLYLPCGNNRDVPGVEFCHECY